MSSMKLFLLVDGHAVIYRAYHAYPDLTDPNGMLVNAVYGFTRILLTAIRDREPEYLAVAFDHKDPTFRHDSFKDYKAHREAMPDDLIPQIEVIKRVVTALNIPQFELAGFEADDLVGTLSLQAEQLTKQTTADDITSLIVTGDKDLLQLVTDKTEVFMPARGKLGKDMVYTPSKVQEKMGVTPEQVPDLKGLMGDSSDNIPGVKGIGPKTAAKLINHFGSIEQLYQQIAEVAPEELLATAADSGLSKSVLAKLQADQANAVLSKDLATINRAAPVELDLSACTVRQYDKDSVIALFEELGFRSLVGLLPDDSFEHDLQAALF